MESPAEPTQPKKDNKKKKVSKPVVLTNVVKE